MEKHSRPLPVYSLGVEPSLFAPRVLLKSLPQFRKILFRESTASQSRVCSPRKQLLSLVHLAQQVLWILWMSSFLQIQIPCSTPQRIPQRIWCSGFPSSTRSVLRMRSKDRWICRHSVETRIIAARVWVRAFLAQVENGSTGSVFLHRVHSRSLRGSKPMWITRSLSGSKTAAARRIPLS